jgi:hypothetical protein
MGCGHVTGAPWTADIQYDSAKNALRLRAQSGFGAAAAGRNESMRVLEKLKRLLGRDRDGGKRRDDGGRDIAQRRMDRVGDLSTGYVPKGPTTRGARPVRTPPPPRRLYAPSGFATGFATDLR